MARNKRRNKSDLRKKKADTPAYWEEVLQREGLTMAAGRNRRLLYVGGSSTLEGLQGALETDTGRVGAEKGDS